MSDTTKAPDTYTIVWINQDENGKITHNSNDGYWPLSSAIEEVCDWWDFEDVGRALQATIVNETSGAIERTYTKRPSILEAADVALDHDEMVAGLAALRAKDDAARREGV